MFIARGKSFLNIVEDNLEQICQIHVLTLVVRTLTFFFSYYLLIIFKQLTSLVFLTSIHIVCCSIERMIILSRLLPRLDALLHVVLCSTLTSALIR